ncbi:hypothetical protein RUM44_001830 [Polyplax serrata]|uniref:Major facilitator superfamily (MFS) profile domain-containing protein n=1 Tax=Polyplax serrata TaxID=468196 RepID=A0ABR1AMY2_POLSC
MSNSLMGDKEPDISGRQHDPRENGKTKKAPQFVAAFAVNIAYIITGTVIGWTSPTLPILEGPNSPIPINKEESSWIASLMPVGAVLGPFAAGYTAEKFGRKNSLLLSVIPSLVSWIVLATVKSIPVIYAARFVAGFAVGWIFTVVPIYGGEIADKTVRGAILSASQLFIVFGLLFEYCIGPYVPYAWLSIGGALIPLLFAVIFWWMPESPYYYLSVGEKGKAEKSLQWLRGKWEGESYELIDIQASVEKAKCEKGSFKDIFATRGNTKAFIISLGLVTFQQFSGINIVLFYSQSIFEKAGGSLKPEESAIVIGVIMMLASCVTPLVVDRVGRKTLLILSATGMIIAHATLGLCFFLDMTGVKTTALNFLPLVAVIGYIIIYSFGFGPLPWSVMGEMFPSNIKSLASAITASYCWILAFLITRFFNDIVDTFGSHYTFWLFGVCCVLAVIFVYFLLPETKGKSLSEIQRILNNSS